MSDASDTEFWLLFQVIRFCRTLAIICHIPTAAILISSNQVTSGTNLFGDNVQSPTWLWSVKLTVLAVVTDLIIIPRIIHMCHKVSHRQRTDLLTHRAHYKRLGTGFRSPHPPSCISKTYRLEHWA